jgi:GntR family transcriptional regulator of arabinose operon
MDDHEPTTRISQAIRTRIYRGELRPGERIPSEHQLSRQFGVNRNQARRALLLLEVEGLIYRRQGSGSFVREIRNQPLPGLKQNVLTVAVAVQQFSYRYGKTITASLMDALHAHGVQTITFNIDFDDESEYRFVHEVHYGGYDGLALWPQHNGELIRTMLRTVLAERFPVVVYDSYFDDVPCDAVCTDNDHLGYTLMNELLGAGCERPAFIGAEEHATFLSVQRRWSGALRALRSAGIPDAELRMVRLPSEKEEITSMEPLLKVMASPRRPDGILFTHCGIAEAVLPELRGMGWRIGADLKAALVDDDLYRRRAGFPVIAMEQPARKIGRETARLLLHRIRHPGEEPVHRLLKAARVFRTKGRR